MEKKMVVFAAAIALVVLFAGCILPGTNGGNMTVANLTYTIDSGSNPMLGNPNASIYIVEFTDYQCPYCGEHARNTFPLIEQDYVNTGKARYYLRDFPLSSIHQNADSAAIAARCAGAQGKYWEMHSLLFAKQGEWSMLSGDALKYKFEEYATNVSMDPAAFSSCYDRGFASQMSQDVQAGQAYGVSGTPSSLIVLPKTANETKLLAVLSANPRYAGNGLSLARDSQGNYVFFIKGAFNYGIFQSVLDS